MRLPCKAELTPLDDVPLESSGMEEPVEVAAPICMGLQQHEKWPASSLSDDAQARINRHLLKGVAQSPISLRRHEQHCKVAGWNMNGTLGVFALSFRSADKGSSAVQLRCRQWFLSVIMPVGWEVVSNVPKRKPKVPSTGDLYILCIYLLPAGCSSWESETRQLQHCEVLLTVLMASHEQADTARRSETRACHYLSALLDVCSFLNVLPCSSCVILLPGEHFACLELPQALSSYFLRSGTWLVVALLGRDGEKSYHTAGVVGAVLADRRPAGIRNLQLLVCEKLCLTHGGRRPH